jgi:aspartate carbamoyltransferase catalytic subunit
VNRHLISAADLSRDDALLVLDTADELARVSDRPIKKLPTLRGRTVVNLFFEDSTRTRISFEAAAKRLSADVINFSAKGSSVATIRRRFGRGSGSGTGPPGAGPGRGGALDGLRVTIVGDILHSRVARSNVLLLHTLGAEVLLVAPPTLLPVAVDAWPCSVGYDLDAALPKSDVVMMLRLQQERMNAAFFPSVREYSRRYGLDSARMAQLPERAIVMHPGPMNRGVEIAAGVADSPRSTVVEQVANGVSVRMAVLYLLLGGAEAGQ